MRPLQRFQTAISSASTARGVALMGVCNVTPDSFSDGGKYLEPARARERIDELIREGADLIDIGGESTRPGAKSVSTEEQLVRVREPIEYAVSKGACVSIDTTCPRVAEVCLGLGAHAVNDVSCLRDVDLAKVTGRAGAAFILMHARGTQEEMSGYGSVTESSYLDVVSDVVQEWESAALLSREFLLPGSLVMDPGLGFAKSQKHSLTLLRSIKEIVQKVKVPVLVGASRKSFLKCVDSAAEPQNRVGASIAAAIHSAREGAAIVRVHDVRATRQAIDLMRLVSSNTPASQRGLA